MFPERLETTRLLLRPFQLADAVDVLGYANDELWSTYLPVPFPYTRRDAEVFIAQRILEDESKERTWVVEYDGHAIGGINISLYLARRVASATMNSFYTES
jgi:RimJ/RimL family protein N-acetyltransferase